MGFLTAEEAREITMTSDSSDECITLKSILRKVRESALCGKSECLFIEYDKEEKVLDFVDSNLRKLGYKVRIEFSSIPVTSTEFLSTGATVDKFTSLEENRIFISW